MVGRLMLVVVCVIALGPDRRRAGSLQPDRAGAEPGDDLHRPLRPARADRRQPGDAARRAAAHGALHQRLPVQLQPVQPRAGQPAGERAAAVARRRLHLRVRSLARRLPAHDAELRPDSRRPRRDDRRPARVDGLRAAALHVRLDRGRSRWARCRRSSRTTTPQLLGGREDVVTTINAIDADVNQSTTFVTMGVTDRFDLSLAVPLVATDLSDRVRGAHPAPGHDQPADALLPPGRRQRREPSASSRRMAAPRGSAT